MKSYIFIILMWVFATLVKWQIGETYLFSGNHKVANFTQQYSMEVWYNNEQGEDYYYFVLLFVYPLPSYQQHMYLSVGFGSKSYDSADIVIWIFYKNEGNWTDRHNGRFPVTPVFDQLQNVQRFRSDATYDKYVTMGFKRKINTGDTADDYVFQPGNYTDLIWSYGEVNSTTGDTIKAPTYYRIRCCPVPLCLVPLWIWKNLGLWKNYQQKFLWKKLCLRTSFELNLLFFCFFYLNTIQ